MRSAAADHDDGGSWLDDVYGRYGQEIHAFCRQVTGDPSLADQITQEVFVRAWRAREQLDTRPGSLRAWLRQAARDAVAGTHPVSAADPDAAVAAVQAADLVESQPSADLLARIHAATGPAPASGKARLAPSWLGRWTPVVVAAVLAIVVIVVALTSNGDTDEGDGSGPAALTVAATDSRE